MTHSRLSTHDAIGDLDDPEGSENDPRLREIPGRLLKAPLVPALVQALSGRRWWFTFSFH